MRALFTSLHFRIFSLFWLLFSLLLALALFIPRLDARQFSELKNDELQTYQMELVSAIRTNQIDRLLVMPEQVILEKGQGIRPILFDEKNNQLIGAKESEKSAVNSFVEMSKDSTRPLTKLFYNLELAGPFTVHFQSQHNHSYQLYFIKYVDPQREFANYLFDHPFIIIVLIMLISSPLLWWLVWSLSRPIKRLQEAANRVKEGRFTINKELETKGVLELRQVGKSFNQMLQAIDDLINTRQMLFSSISHELRTPLTRLQLATALIRRRDGESPELKRIVTEAERLEKMINDLLRFSKRKAMLVEMEMEMEIIPLNQLWLNVIEDTLFEAEQMNITFSCRENIEYPELYYVTANYAEFSSALENILRNALKYTHSQIQATFSLEGNHCLIVCVEDDGDGVPSDQYENIFKPFYRVDTARTRTTGGVGLGLAIVSNIIQQHRGKVWAEKSELGGLKVVIQLPLNQTATQIPLHFEK
ncbi:MAG: envelope stress sensor histidine kinase CpxA [Lonepinella koalarum]|nr:envelope stress sensor histidine kinase CpxA [Lonepinella koalarum]